jgi:hypothetical protein
VVAGLLPAHPRAGDSRRGDFGRWNLKGIASRCAFGRSFCTPKSFGPLADHWWFGSTFPSPSALAAVPAGLSFSKFHGSSSSPDPDALRTLRNVSIRRLTSLSYDGIASSAAMRVFSYDSQPVFEKSLICRHPQRHYYH